MFIKRKLEKYLKENLQPRKRMSVQRLFEKEEDSFEMQDYEESKDFYKQRDINTFIETNKEEDTFQTKLFQFIDEKCLKNSDVYNKVNIDRRLFSKIRSNKNYHPSKETVILLGFALELSEEEIEDFLQSASYSLPMNTTFDLIIRFCFKEKIYNVNRVNEFLYEHECKVLNN